MTRVIEHLVELTGFRDRDVLDVTLVGAFKDLLRPKSVAIYRCVGEVGQQRWLTRARLGPQDDVATADPMWTPFESLPELDSQPDRRACLQRQEAFTVRGAPAMAYFPLATEREPVGVLEIATAKVLSLAEMRLVGSILRIYRNFQRLLDYSERDTLTGLLNRKTFDENFLRTAQLDSESTTSGSTDDARRQCIAAEPWLGVIDIDHFKRVNDEYGHLMGDAVLQAVTDRIASVLRAEDCLARWGGEEFAVLAPDIDRDGVTALAERAREALADEPIRVGDASIHLTLSVGAALAADGRRTPDALVHAADQALYEAKDGGRNCVRIQEAGGAPSGVSAP
jgi:diguanylate cyclase (GGDEF)-like protein